MSSPPETCFQLLGSVPKKPGCILKGWVESTRHSTVHPSSTTVWPAYWEPQKASQGHTEVRANRPACQAQVPHPQNPTSTFQAVIEEAGVPLCWEGVEGQVLGFCSSKLHVGPVLILVVLQRLVRAVQGADVGFRRELAGDEPLPHNAFGDDRILLARGVGRV